MYVRRSKEGPMDFEYTNERKPEPPWSTLTAQKRPFSETRPVAPSFPEPTPPFPQPQIPQNVPFLFHTPPPSNPHPQHYWQPPAPEVAMQELGSSPDKDEGTEGTSSARPVATGAIARVYKAREKEKQKLRIQSRRRAPYIDEEDEDEEHSEDDHDERRQNVVSNNHYTLHMPSPVLNHSDVPYLLLGYLQFFFNLSFVLVALYLVVQFILTVQRDVEQKVAEYSLEILQEIATCTSLYQMNRCSEPIPATAKLCADYEGCMARDPSVVGRARVGAEMIGQVVNSFVEPISWKTLAFGLASLSFFIVFMNTLLTFYRSRHAPTPTPPPHSQPPTPHHYLPPPPAPYFLQSPPLASEWPRTWSDHSRAPSRARSATPARKRRLLGNGIKTEVEDDD